jgi:lysophospholipase L1-like esterase
MIIQPNSKLLMIGDSVTDCGRTRPIGEGLHPALGHGYVAFVDSLLMAGYPAHHIRVVNMGISGNTIRDLKKRWQKDVLNLEPDWLSICIGINDVWRKFGSFLQIRDHVPLDEYAHTLDELVGQTRPSLKGLILMTPYYIEPDTAEPMRAMMDQFGTAVRQIAEKHEAIIVDTQAAFDAVLSHVPVSTLAPDQVHPTHAGHMVLARAFVRAIGYEWE